MLQTFISQLNVTDLLIFLLSTVGGALLVWYRKKFSRWLAFWRSVLDGLRCVPELRDDVSGIRYYVAPNGGGSLSDAMKRTESALDVLSDQLDTLTRTALAENDTESEVGRFYFNEVGELIYANKLLARWLGVGKSDLTGWNWVNFIHKDSVQSFRAQWDLCRAEHRQFFGSYSVVAASGGQFTVAIEIIPIPDAPPAKRWVGTVRKDRRTHRDSAEAV